MSNTTHNEKALLVLHVQEWVVDRFVDDTDALLGPLTRAVAAARAAGVRIVYVVPGYRAAQQTLGHRDRHLTSISAAFDFTTDAPDTRVHPALAPHPDDVVVTHRRIGAFTGSDLDLILRSLHVRSLVITGVSTRGVVLSTIRQAHDLDYALTILRDGCADRERDAHELLMDKVFPLEGAVLDADAWISGL